MICWSVTPKVNTRGEDSLSTGRFCLGSDGSGRYQNNMRGSMFDNIKSSLDDNIPKCTSHSRWAGPSTVPSHTGLPGSLRKGKWILKFVSFWIFFSAVEELKRWTMCCIDVENVAGKASHIDASASRTALWGSFCKRSPSSHEIGIYLRWGEVSLYLS